MWPPPVFILELAYKIKLRLIIYKRDFSRRLKPYESEQHPHAISLGYLLVVHSKKGACLLKGKKDATIML